MVESIDELSDILNINIIKNLEKKKNYYYLNHNLLELYILDFNIIIDNKNNLNYLNNVLNLNLKKIQQANLSKNKDYYNKYQKIKKKLGKKLDSTIENKYDSFYFNAF